MAGLLDALEIKRKSFFEFEGAPFVCLDVEVDRTRIERRVRTGYCDAITESLDEALAWAREACARKTARSIALVGNAADTHPEILKRGVLPDVVTDQTSAHDNLNGYVPHGIPYAEALRLRAAEPADYVRRAGLNREPLPQDLEGHVRRQMYQPVYEPLGVARAGRPLAAG